MCVNCGNISCSSCDGRPNVAKNTSDIKYDGSKFACGSNFVINKNQDLNKLIIDLSKSLCTALTNDPDYPKSFSIGMPPNDWEVIESAPFMGYYFAVHVSEEVGVGGSAPVIHNQDDFGIIGLSGFPFTIDRNICSEDFTLNFINLPAGFSQGGGDGIIAYPHSTWEIPSDAISLDWDAVAEFTGIIILEISTPTCGTIEVPYFVDIFTP